MYWYFIKQIKRYWNAFILDIENVHVTCFIINIYYWWILINAIVLLITIDHG